MRSESRNAVRPAQAAPRALLAIFAFAALLATACSPKKEDNQSNASPSNVILTADQRSHIRIFSATRSQFHKSIDTTGTVDFDNDQATSVLAPFSGPVVRLLVSPGDKVKKGDALAIVDSADFSAAASAYAKALATAQTSRKLADADKDLVTHDGIAQREAQQAETDAANAEADRDAALQALMSLGVDPQTIKDIQQGKPVSRSPGTIRAPIAGTVVEKLISPGQLLQAGTTPAFTIADLSRVWVMAQIYDGDLGSVAVGDPAEIDTGIDRSTMPGTVDNISALVNPDTRSVVARVVVPNPGDFLKKQMYVRVLIKSRQESSGVLVPVSAILRDDENLPFVYVLQRDGSFARQHVTLGSRTADQYDISAGLSPGARVVTDGGLFVQFMQNQ